ncbi:MAG: lytic transglycosylase domain-containing protein [Acidobacteria bacterium]|nr:lytic transglycosylase domain-containing protein [Acidobacteriota bacterium]
MKSIKHPGVFPKRAATAVLLALSISPAWCPEAPVLERLQQAMLAPSLVMSPEEMIAMLARHDVRHLPRDFEVIARAVNDASRTTGVSPELVLAVIGAESEFQLDAVSNQGAVGLMQLMPDTAQELAAELEIPWSGPASLRDPRTNVTLGTLYLRRLLTSFDDLDHALAAYNRGPYAVPGSDPIPAGETAEYVRRVKELLTVSDTATPSRSFGPPTPFRASQFLTL